MQCDPTSKNTDNNIAVHLAVVNGHFDTVKFLLNQTCDPNIQGLYGRTPLHCAAEFGHLYIVKYLTDE